MIKGTLNADGLAVLELSADLRRPAAPAVKAKAAFVNTTTGATLGWTEQINWSKHTMTLLKELVESMEEDIASSHFEGGDTTSGGSRTREPQGLAEHLKGDDAPPL